MRPVDYAQIADAAYTLKPFAGKMSDAGRAVQQTTKDGVVISFPGSDNLESWLADLDAMIRQVPGLGYVHDGFWQSWESISSTVMDVVGVESCTLVGHSLGGALAIIAGAALCLIGKAPKEIWAFEPPRVSIDNTIAWLFAANNVKVNLYRNGNDLVPMIPRIIHDWQQPAGMIQIGVPALEIPNIEDHLLKNVIHSLETET